MRNISVPFLLPCLILAGTTLSPKIANAEKRPLLAGALNFFVPGAGYAYNGDKPLYLTVPMILGTAGLVYVEQIHEFDDGNTLQEHDSTAFGVMFAAVFIANTAFAVDAYQEAGRINSRQNRGVASLRLDLKPITASNGTRELGISLSGSF